MSDADERTAYSLAEPLEMHATLMTNGNEPEQPEQPEQPEHEDGPESPAVADSTPAMTDSARESGVPFLQSLVDAMRKIAEQTRTDAMTQLHAAVAERSADLRTETERRAAELHELANSDLATVAEWERGEVQRIRDEAAGKVGARNATLEAQLAANAAAGEGSVAAVQARVEAFGAEMTSFFAQLNEIHDPAALASALKQIPQPPSLADASAAPAGDTAPTPSEATAAAPDSMPEPTPEPEPMPEPTPEPEPMPEPAVADAVAVSAAASPADHGNGVPHAESAEPSTPVEEAAVATATREEPAVEGEAPVEAPAVGAGDEATTQVLVSGLTSFGAITSFKQSLERAEGIHKVSLGLGTSGEFIFTATHSPAFDLGAAIRSFEESAQFVQGNGQLRVTVGVKA
jgi:hypothetical protein